MQHIRVENTWRRTSPVAERVDAEVRRTGARVLKRSRATCSRGRRRATPWPSVAALDRGSTSSTAAAGAGRTRERRASRTLGGARPSARRRAQAGVERGSADRGARARAPDGLRARRRRAAASPSGLARPRGASSPDGPQVDTLLLDGGVTRDGELWVGQIASQVATDAERLRGLGSEPVGQVPVDAALLAAAAASGAAFEPLGGGRTGLVGKPVEGRRCCATRW